MDLTFLAAPVKMFVMPMGSRMLLLYLTKREWYGRVMMRSEN